MIASQPIRISRKSSKNCSKNTEELLAKRAMLRMELGHTYPLWMKISQPKMLIESILARKMWVNLTMHNKLRYTTPKRASSEAWDKTQRKTKMEVSTICHSSNHKSKVREMLPQKVKVAALRCLGWAVGSSLSLTHKPVRVCRFTHRLRKATCWMVSSNRYQLRGKIMMICFQGI